MTRRHTLPADPEAVARAAGLRYVLDDVPGFTRRRRGKSFSYYTPEGRVLRDNAARSRIEALVIPPAWRDVWISPSPKGHLQATGRDDRGRKQYRYHALWNQLRNRNKYHRLLEFGQALPRIRRRTAAHLREKGLTRRKVLAAVVRLLQETGLRIGNDEYARTNNSYGLTTLRRRHFRREGKSVRLEFRGKRGRRLEATIEDPRLVRILRNCAEIPGYELFKYVDDAGEKHVVDSADVNEYLREISDGEFTAKDFRTWIGTLGAARALRDSTIEKRTKTRIHKCTVAAVREAADLLSNRPATCRKYYVHPTVIRAFECGRLAEQMRKDPPRTHRKRGLSKDEQSLLALLAQKA